MAYTNLKSFAFTDIHTLDLRFSARLVLHVREPDSNENTRCFSTAFSNGSRACPFFKTLVALGRTRWLRRIVRGERISEKDMFVPGTESILFSQVLLLTETVKN